MKPHTNENLDAAAIGAALNELANTIKRAFATSDADLYVSAFTEDAILSMPAMPQARGKAAIKEFFINRPELPPGATFEVEPTEIEILSSEWAYAFGVDTLKYTPPGSGKELTETMTFMVLIRKTSDGWKTYREVLSADQTTN